MPLQLCLAYMLPAEIMLNDAPMGACGILCLLQSVICTYLRWCVQPPACTDIGSIYTW